MSIWKVRIIRKLLKIVGSHYTRHCCLSRSSPWSLNLRYRSIDHWLAVAATVLYKADLRQESFVYTPQKKFSDLFSSVYCSVQKRKMNPTSRILSWDMGWSDQSWKTFNSCITAFHYKFNIPYCDLSTAPSLFVQWFLRLKRVEYRYRNFFGICNWYIRDSQRPSQRFYPVHLMGACFIVPRWKH